MIFILFIFTRYLYIYFIIVYIYFIFVSGFMIIYQLYKCKIKM